MHILCSTGRKGDDEGRQHLSDEQACEMVSSGGEYKINHVSQKAFLSFVLLFFLCYFRLFCSIEVEK